MCYTYKRRVAAADRAIFNRWLRGVAVFYGLISLVITCATALVSHYTDGKRHNDIAAITSSPPSPSPRSR